MYRAGLEGTSSGCAATGRTWRWTLAFPPPGPSTRLSRASETRGMRSRFSTRSAAALVEPGDILLERLLSIVFTESRADQPPPSALEQPNDLGRKLALSSRRADPATGGATAARRALAKVSQSRRVEVLREHRGLLGGVHRLDQVRPAVPARGSATPERPRPRRGRPAPCPHSRGAPAAGARSALRCCAESARGRTPAKLWTRRRSIRVR